MDNNAENIGGDDFDADEDFIWEGCGLVKQYYTRFLFVKMHKYKD